MNFYSKYLKEKKKQIFKHFKKQEILKIYIWVNKIFPAESNCLNDIQPLFT